MSVPSLLHEPTRTIGIPNILQIPINKYKITCPIFRDRNSFRIMFCCIHIGCPSTTQYYIIISNSPIHVNRLKNNDEETMNDDDASIIIVVGFFNADRWQDNGFNNNRLCHYIYSLYMYCMVQCIRENPYACSFFYTIDFFFYFLLPVQTVHGLPGHLSADGSTTAEFIAQ